MVPTLDIEGNVLSVDGWTLRRRRVKRNEVVVLHSYAPESNADSVCKRVIGVEGDMIRLAPGNIMTRVPKGHVWLEGDNPYNSHDSRAYGPVPEALIIGRVIARVFPPSMIGFVDHNERPHWTHRDIEPNDRILSPTRKWDQESWPGSTVVPRERFRIIEPNESRS